MADWSAGPVAVIGAGLIGASWSALFLARGASVSIHDPRPDIQGGIRRALRSAWPRLSELKLATGEIPWDRLHFAASIQAACEGAVFVQENGPDLLSAKQEIIARIEQAAAPEVIIASSTSSLMPSDLQRGAVRPGRILVAHPMNPPHLVPMVELVAGQHTTAETVDAAEAFYRTMDRVVIRVRKEVVGHLANRLTAALYREAVHLVADGVGTVEDVDKAIAHGPGMRWALMGPHLIYHLGGGESGYRGYLEHLGQTQEARWQELGTPKLDEETREKLIAGLQRELDQQDQDSLGDRRDRALVELTKLKCRFGF